MWILIAGSFIRNGYLETWSLWKFPAELPPFLDFRLIPAGAQTYWSGQDPSISNPYDPRGRIFNYPKIWYLLFYTGIGQNDTVWICVVLIFLFFLIVFAFPERIRIRDAIPLLLIVFSPACMLLYERGNVDLLIFILCGLSILLIQGYPILSEIILLFATILKLFPLFGVTVFFQKTKRGFYISVAAAVIAFAGYILFSYNSFSALWNLTQRGTFMSYGIDVVFDLLHAYFRYYLLKGMAEGDALSLIAKLPYLAAFSLLTVVFIAFMKWGLPLQTSSKRNLAAFRMGASIYIGTFLLGHNWDYRLAFLIFAIPQLLNWFSSSSGRTRWLISGVLFTLFASCWSLVIISWLVGIFGYDHDLLWGAFDETMNWMLFAGLAYLLTASAPEWFRSFAWNPLKQSGQY